MIVIKQLLKDTTGLCPVCLEEIGAQLFLEDGKITIIKECAMHGASCGLVDPDARLYLQAASKRQKRYPPYGLVLPVTTKCNLNCPWCYLPQEIEQPSVEYLKNIIDKCHHRYIVFSGGEPTVREELCELISYLRQKHPQKFALILTNGLKLADAEYVKKLKDAGLQYAIISFDGFRPETHQSLSGRDLTELKLRALKNMEKFKIWTILSVTLAKGINEDELAKIYRYGIRNIHFIRQIRLRNVSEIGVYKKGEHIYLSDMLKLVCDAAGFSIEELSKDNLITNRIFKTGNYFVVDIFEMLKRRYKNQRFGGLKYWICVAKLVGIVNALKMMFEPSHPIETKFMFRIEIFAWPTPSNIDLAECRLFCIDHVTNKGEVLPFWEALYVNDKMKLKKIYARIN